MIIRKILDVNGDCKSQLISYKITIGTGIS